jgi:hypothetical protein
VKDIARVTSAGGTFLVVSNQDPKDWADDVGMAKYFRFFQEKQLSLPCGNKVVLAFVHVWKRKSN